MFLHSLAMHQLASLFDKRPNCIGPLDPRTTSNPHRRQVPGAAAAAESNLEALPIWPIPATDNR